MAPSESGGAIEEQEPLFADEARIDAALERLLERPGFAARLYARLVKSAGPMGHSAEHFGGPTTGAASPPSPAELQAFVDRMITWARARKRRLRFDKGHRYLLIWYAHLGRRRRP